MPQPTLLSIGYKENDICMLCLCRAETTFSSIKWDTIKATQSFEWLNIDFKGPLPSSSKNKYMLTIVDEFSRFPFVFPCQDINSSAVIKCLCQLFAIFGMPSYMHSDRGSSLISEELKQFSVDGELQQVEQAGIIHKAMDNVNTIMELFGRQSLSH